MKRLTHKEFCVRVEKAQPGKVEILGIYKKSQVKVSYRCLLCGKKSSALAQNLMRGQGCYTCGQEKRARTQTLTHDTYLQRLAKAEKTLKPLEKYIRIDTPIKHKCLTCDARFSISPYQALRLKFGCTNCSVKSGRAVTGKIKIARSSETYPSRIKHTTWKLIGKFTGVNNATLHKCKVCKLTHLVHPSNVLCGMGCVHCAERNRIRGQVTNKTYELGSRTVHIQGYENFALDYLRSVVGIRSTSIKVCADKIPVVHYTYKGKQCRHYPDIFIPSKNRLIEVKGEWTIGLSGKNGASVFKRCQLKAIAARKAGYSYKLYLFKGAERVPLPKQ